MKKVFQNEKIYFLRFVHSVYCLAVDLHERGAMSMIQVIWRNQIQEVTALSKIYSSTGIN